MRKRLALHAAIIVAATGCEHGITLSATVRVPPALTQTLTESLPGVVVVSATVPKSSVPTSRLAVICAPLETELALEWNHDGFGCAKEGEVTARLFTVDAAMLSAACGVATEADGAPAGATEVAEGSSTVFEGNTSGAGCSSGTDAVEIVLAPVGP